MACSKTKYSNGFLANISDSKPKISEQQFYKTVFLNKHHSCYQECSVYHQSRKPQKGPLMKMKPLEYPSDFLGKTIDSAIKKPFPSPLKLPRKSSIKFDIRNKQQMNLAEEQLFKSRAKAKIAEIIKKTKKVEAEVEKEAKRTDKVNEIIKNTRMLHNEVKERLSCKSRNWNTLKAKTQYNTLPQALDETKKIKPKPLTVYSKYMEGIVTLRERLRFLQNEELFDSINSNKRASDLKKEITGKYLEAVKETVKETPFEYGGFSYRFTENSKYGIMNNELYTMKKLGRKQIRNTRETLRKVGEKYSELRFVPLTKDLVTSLRKSTQYDKNDF